MAPHDPDRRRTRRWVIAAIAGALVGAVGVAVAVAAWPRADREPVVRLVQPVPADVEAEVRAAVAEFVAVFEPRRDCIGGAAVELVATVGGGDARYRAEHALIEIEIPTTPERFRESLVHELAHHVEHSCADFDELRVAILELQGETAWASQPHWPDRPSEQWAETVVAIVLDERVRHGGEIPLDLELIELVAAWIAP